MIIKEIHIEKFRAFENVSFSLGRCLTAISGRNATQKTTVLGMLGQPFTISNGNRMYGCKTIDGYNFKSQFSEKFKISPAHDIIGNHKWTLDLHQGIYDHNSYSIQSIARIQNGKEPTLRFWNSKSKAKNAGYIQLPVYFLSLSRFFPIGETRKTDQIPIHLTDEEIKYCIQNYSKILSIHDICENTEIDLEKGSNKVFAGVNDEIHDILSNSAGESNVMRIIIAILSFKRLKETYVKEYKGGLLLIDELDATLYGYSQKKLVEFLSQAAKEYKIQIVFTTHSPIILKCVKNLQREEINRKGSELPNYSYDNAIVHLEPYYDEDGKRFIKPKNITSSKDFNEIIDDINLTVSTQKNKVNIYCEDKLASDFVKFILLKEFNTNPELYMDFIGIDMGWTNYIHLYNKEIPEFRENLIILDGDIPGKSDFRNYESTINESKNILLLPLVVEKDLFILLKDHSNFNQFNEKNSSIPSLNYDICFRDWTLNASEYGTKEIKKWFNYVKDIIGNNNLLFEFWCEKNTENCKEFVNEFIRKFNETADIKEIDRLPKEILKKE